MIKTTVREDILLSVAFFSSASSELINIMVESVVVYASTTINEKAVLRSLLEDVVKVGLRLSRIKKLARQRLKELENEG